MEENELAELAKGAKDCLDWLHICKAACCTVFVLHSTKGWEGVKKGDVIHHKTNVNPGMRWYYRLHNARLERNTLIFTLEDFEVQGNNLIVKNRCEYLTEENKCKHHEDGLRPQVCKDYTPETYSDPRFYKPHNCLYKYKQG